MQRDALIKLRVAEAEAVAIKAKAAECGLTVSEFLRTVALNRRIRTTPAAVLEWNARVGKVLLQAIARELARDKRDGSSADDLAYAEELAGLVAMIGNTG